MHFILIISIVSFFNIKFFSGVKIICNYKKLGLILINMQYYSTKLFFGIA